MSFSSSVKDELSKKDFTSSEKTFNINSETDRRLRAREFLRKAFLRCGSVSDPNKNYHLEFVCDDVENAKEIREKIQYFDIEAKIIERGKYYVVYMKDGAQIVDMLNVIGAHSSLMAFENVRIWKEVRESINRRVNCETANINKTVSASLKQQKDIEYIRDTVGLDYLDDGLRQVAQARLEYTEATLSELVRVMGGSVGKSGVNHRLRRLSEIAEQLRQKQENSHG